MKLPSDTPRAERRHHRERLKHTRKTYWGLSHAGLTPEQREKRIGQAVSTAAPCSCFLCGNPRKFVGEKTLQEQKMLQRERIPD